MVFWFVYIVLVRFKFMCFGWFTLFQVAKGFLEFVSSGVSFFFFRKIVSVCVCLRSM